MHGGPLGYSGECIDFRYLDASMQSFQGRTTSSMFSSFMNYEFFRVAGLWGFNKNYASNLNVWGEYKGFRIVPNAAKITKHNDHGHLTFTN